MGQSLPPPVTTVEAIQVVPARLPAAESDKAFSIITLDQAEIGDHRRLDQALGEVPGVVLFRRTDSLVANPTTQGISLRSIGPTGAGRALVTLDGVPMNDPFGGWVIWAGLPSEMIGSADIVRGGGAGPYGAGALTGVIRLDSRTDMGLEASARAGSLDTQRGALVDVTTVGGTDVLASVSGGHTGGFIPVHAGKGAADTPTEMNDWSVNLRTTSDFAEGRLAFALGAFNQDQGSGLDKARAEAKGQRGSVTWVRNPAGGALGFRAQGWVMSTNLFNSSVSVPAGRATTTVTNTQFDTPATGYGLNAAIRGDSETRQWEIGADVRISHGEDRELFSYTLTNGPFTRYAGGMSQIAGVYAEGTMKRDDLLLTASVRADQWKNTDGHRIHVGQNGAVTVNNTYADRDSTLPTARVGARYNTDTGYYRLAAYTGFRAPTLNELYRPFRVGNINTESNAALDPERLAGIELGFGGHKDMLGSWDITLFYNQLSDAIFNVTLNNDPSTRQRQNAGDVIAKGLEAQGELQLTDTIRLRGAYAYVEAKTDAGLRPAETSPNSASGSITWSPSPRFDAALTVRYEGDRFDDDLNLIRLRSATVADIRLGWKFTDSVEGFIDVNNAFDEAVENTLSSGVLSYAAPQTFSLGLRVKR